MHSNGAFGNNIFVVESNHEYSKNLMSTKIPCPTVPGTLLRYYTARNGKVGGAWEQG